MNEIKSIVDSMDLESCKTTLEHINKELHNLTEGNTERLSVISNLCLLVREKIDQLTIKNDSKSNNNENSSKI